jgi:hypothetical protein
MADTATGVVRYGSELERKGWMVRGLVQARSTSFWEGLTGGQDAVVYQENDLSKGAGHEVVFDFDGNLSSKAHVDKEQAFGNSEQKKKFSDKLRVRRLRWSVDNGDEFDAINIGSLDLTTHEDSRSKLSDLFIRSKDQFLFDAAQGFLSGNGPSHVIRPNGKATVGDLVATDIAGYDFMMDVEDVIKSGDGFTEGDKRRPMEPFTLADGTRKWLWIVDSRVARDIRKDDGFTSIVSSADYRGVDNRLIKGVIGTIGSLIVIEAQNFFGVSSSKVIGKTEVEVSGLRKVDSNGLFEGEAGFGASGSVIASRSLILGRGALQIGMGKMPDYRWQPSEDFGIKSESALITYMNVQKTVLMAETEDYEDAKVAGYDYGVVCVDTFFRAVA